MSVDNELDGFTDDELLKSISELDAEILKAMGGESASSSTGVDDDSGESESDESDESDESLARAMADDESDSESESDESQSDDGSTEGESSTAKGYAAKGLLAGKEVNRAGGAGAVDHKAPHNAITQKGKKGHFRSSSIEKGASEPGMGVDVASALDPHVGPELSKQSGKHAKGHGKMAKSFSDVASPEAERTLDVTPFLAAQAETLDSLAEVVNSLAKSVDGFGSKDELLAKSVVDLGRGMIDTRRQLAEVFESLNDIRKGLRMPVRYAPKAALAKSEAGAEVERFSAPPSLSKAQTAGIITDLVIKGLVDPMAVSAYEATGWMDQTTERAVQTEISARFSRKA